MSSTVAAVPDISTSILLLGEFLCLTFVATRINLVTMLLPGVHSSRSPHSR